ncbi:MAG: heavy-metal-associated domain-containing protein, partial [Planctomycetota bacterium]
AATIATVWKTMGRRTAITYLTTVAATAFGAGLLLNLVLKTIDPMHHTIEHAHGAFLPPWLASAAAVVLLLVLGWAFLGPLLARRKGVQLDGRGIMTTLAIKGMTCSHCVATVEKALRSVPGADEVSVDLKGGKAVVAGDADAAELKRRVEEAGYEVTGVENAPGGEERK